LPSGGDQENWQSLLRLPPMYFDLDLNLQPAIFASWQPNAEMTVWTFAIDPRATWSDGSPVTAADVKGTWELMTDPILENSRIAGYLGNVTGFDQLLDRSATEAAGLVARDERTLEVRLDTPDPILHWRLATTHLTPVKIEQARAQPETFWLPENGPVSSGPYVLEAVDPDQGTAAMGKNPNWWLGEGQYLDRIEFRFVGDPGTVAIMVQNGEVDATLQVLPLELQTQFPGFFRPIDAFGFNTFWLAATVEPTNDANVRKALTLAVNFEDVFAAAFPLGGGKLVTQLLDPDLPCTDETNAWYPYDPDAAKAALAASSYGSAENLPKLRVTPRGVNPVFNRGLESVVEFWRQNLGITNIEFQQQPEAFGPDEARINLTRDDVVIRFPDSATYMWSAAHSAGPAASGEMMRGYANPEVDRLVDQALVIPVEDPQRCQLALEAQRAFMNDYQVLFFGTEDTTLNAHLYVQNYAKGPDRALIAPWRIYIAEH
jgi:peptide/nickel transport system substrate-binding protein